MSKEKNDFEKAKKSLEETIIKILKRNKEISTRLSNIENTKEYSYEEEPDNIKANINLLSKDLSLASKASSDLLTLINSKYPLAISQEQYQKLKFAQTKSSKILSQEMELFNESKAKYTQLASAISKQNKNSIDTYDLNGQSEEDAENAVMIPKTQILSLNHLVQSKNEQVDKIYKKTLLVNEISNEINTFTHSQEEKMETIEENIAQVKEHTKETFKSAFEVAQRDKKYKVNNFYVLLFLILLVLVILTILSNK